VADVGRFLACSSGGSGAPASLAQVRHGTTEFSDFWRWERRKRRVCKGRDSTTRCSADLPSWGLPRL